MSNAASIKTTLTLPDTLHWKLKEEIPKRRTTFKGAVIQALELWLTQKGYQSLIKKEDAPLPETGDKTLPAKEFENVSEDRSYAGLQSRQLREAILALQSSGRIAELHVLTAFAAFLVSYEPSEATPEQARAGSTDPLDRAREVIELAQRGDEAASRTLEERGIKAPPRADAPRPAKRNRKDGSDERAG